MTDDAKGDGGAKKDEADEASEGPRSAKKTVDEVTDALKKLTSSWPGADAESETVPDEAETLAARARKKYDSTVRWAVGAFTALGALIFGSLPFVELAGVDPWRVTIGLILAAIGLGLVIVATTQALEPEDASLGELALTLARSSNKRWWQRGFLGARRRAADDLRSVLEGNEAAAHLGPGLNTVTALIERLKILEGQVLRSTIGWDGSDPEKPPQKWDGSVRSKAEAEAAAAGIEALAGAIKEVREHKPATGENNLDEALRELEERYRSLLQLLPGKDSIEQAGKARAEEAALHRYLQHRRLVLQESLVSQMRGTFRQSRGWLVVGAILTLIGGAQYAYAVANPDEDLVGSLVIATVNAETARSALADCLDGEAAGDYVVLRGILTSTADGERDGPFTLAITQGSCAGNSLTVENGEGFYAPLPGETDATDPAEPTNTPAPTCPPEPTMTPEPPDEQTSDSLDSDTTVIVNSCCCEGDVCTPQPTPGGPCRPVAER